MRGLTMAERAALEIHALSTDIIIDDACADVSRALVKRGLCHAWSDVHFNYWSATELGKLALRVCPREGT